MTEPNDPEFITPERTAELLAQAPARPLNRERVAGYARQMQEGAWRLADGPQAIGPEEARALVGQAAARYVAARLDGKRVAQYATRMLLGTWRASANAIPVTCDGWLLDGLNRLMAIILSGTTQTLIIEHTEGGIADRDEPWHSGPRICDIQPLADDDPARLDL